MPRTARRPFLTRRLARAAVLAVGLAVLAPAAAALAHPLGNFTVNRYSRLEPSASGIRLLYALDIAEIPAFQEQQAADADRDGQVSAAEWDAWKARKVEDLRRGLQLTVDGRTVPLQLESSRVSLAAGQASLPLIRVEASLRADVPGGGERRATYRDTNEPTRVGWREIVVRAGEGATVSGSTAPTTSTSDELRTYPDNLLQSPLDQRQAEWTFRVGGVAGGSPLALLPVAGGATEGAGRAVDPFAALITAADLNAGVVLFALLAAAVLGGIHGASPGHGKTVMAAYIVGTRGTFVHALALAASVTFSHTAGVLVLGAIVVLASNTIVPERLYPWLTLVSGLLVLVIGAGLLARAALSQWGPRRHAHHHHDHDGGHAHDHEHGDGPGQHRHDLPLTWRNLFALGLAGGIVPSASALVVLLSALALGRLGFGLLLIVAFGAGMGIVLTAAGFLMVYAGRLLLRLFPDSGGGASIQGRITRLVPIVSALVMTLAGVAVTIQALGQFGYLPLA